MSNFILHSLYQIPTQMYMQSCVLEKYKIPENIDNTLFRIYNIYMDTAIEELDKARQLVSSVTNSEEQREYMSWRVCGFSITEALGRSGTDVTSLADWYMNSADFMKVDQQQVFELRATLIEDILRSKAIKNSRSLLELDDKVLQIALDQGLSNLTDNEVKYIEKLRPAYDRNNGVRSMLGLDEGEQMPTTMVNFVQLIQEQHNAINTEESQKKPATISIQPDEHKESTG